MRFGLAIALLLGASTAMASPQPSAPIIIAHRGASADRPEHTLMAYKLAIAQGADFIEPDLVATKDGQLVARHENEISGTSDVAEKPEFASRRTKKAIDGAGVEGWFTEDFTLAELKTLRTRERLPQLRAANTAFDRMETIPTFDEILALVKAEEARIGRRIGVYPEIKHPSHFRGLGLPLEEPLLAALSRAGYRNRADPVFIQSFEAGNLEALRPRTELRLIQLMAAEGGPPDRPGISYRQMTRPGALKALARHVDGIGVERALVIPRDAQDRLAQPTSLVADAHAVGLAVHVWTFRPENYFLPLSLRMGEDPVQRGNAAAEIRAFLDAGIDGLFSDSTPDAVMARDRRP
ncbi:MAG: glycerophosphodiester phosphodiesterase [Sandaracinobacter sp.]